MDAQTSVRTAAPSALHFGRFELRPQTRQLLQDGAPTVVGSRAFDVLLTLIVRRDRVVSKSELLELVWPDVVVEENNLPVQIGALRKLLGPQAIATIPGRGYRFTAELDSNADSVAAEPGPTAETNGSHPTASLTNLPAELPPLYGREADLQALRSLIGAHRLVTVVGAGGIGKSRLALSVSHLLAGQWRDGAWIVELAGLADPALLPNAVAQTLGIKLSGQGDALDELVTGLEPCNMLLVLDNCEHLLDAAAGLGKAVMRCARAVTVLATSQEPLHLPDEQQYRVLPLAVPSATTVGDPREFGSVALFSARVRAVDPRFALDDDGMAVVIDICRRLDGLPLAIELAAARVPTLGLRPLRDRLDARFKLLTGGTRAALRRHQTLRAALEWSHNLLSDAERAVFRRLAVFAGGFTMGLAQAVAVGEQLDEWAVLDHLSALVDKSLVVVDAGTVPRYRLLESARAFALEQLAADATADILRRHALAMRDFIERADCANLDCELRSDEFAALVLPELDNLRAAHAWAIAESGDMEIAIALATHAASVIDYAVECVDWFVPLQRRVDSEAVAPALAARYWRAIAAGNMRGRVPLEMQEEAAERALALYRTLDQPRRVFSTLIQLSMVRGARGRLVDARAALEEARGLLRPDWPAEFRCRLLRRDAHLATDAGHLSEAIALYQEELRLSASIGDWRLEVMARNNLVDTTWRIGAIDDAARMAYELIGELRVRPAAGPDMDIVYSNLMEILSELGRLDEAAEVAREAVPIMRRTRNWFVEGWVYLFWRCGQTEAAVRLLGQLDARHAGSAAPLQANESRLIAQVRAALAKILSPVALSNGLAQGAALSETQVAELIVAALARHEVPEVG
jgi:predicted ATPase/DNA-binding winged helix-turn-helix (wHTH) protein